MVVLARGSRKGPRPRGPRRPWCRAMRGRWDADAGTVLSGWVSAALRDGGITLKLRSFDGMHPEDGRTIDLSWRT